MQACKQNHPLSWTTEAAGYAMGVFSCDGCHKSNQCGSGRWSCPGCKFDICPHCRPAPAPNSICKKGHALTWCTEAAGYAMGVFSCDGCRTSSQCGNGRWACKDCKYDICPKCNPPPKPHQFCKKNHPLIWTTDGAGYAMNVFSCDNCHKSNQCGTGRWFCKDCKYDICPNCRPSESAKPYQQCKKNHNLAWSTHADKYPMGVFSCDGCRTSSKCDAGRWNCKECGFDICTKCRPAETKSYDTCKSNHPLAWTTDGTGYAMGVFSCDGCRSSSQCAGGRWCCPGCKFDICPKCRPAPIHKKCKKNHPLAWNHESAGYAMGIFSCDNCHKSSQCSNGKWSCHECKYDICTNCRAPKAHGSCKKMHPLAWTMDASGYAMGVFSCDGCHKSSQCPTGRWNCKECKYDICTNCRAPEPYASCKGNHPLSWTSEASGYPMGVFSCDGCHKSNQCANGRWCCKPCKYDVCPNCRSE